MWKIQWKMWRVYTLSQNGADGACEKNSKFLLIVAELELIFAWCCGGNVWEAL